MKIWGGIGGWILIMFALLWGASCVSGPATPSRPPDRQLTMEVTAYCPCGRCCGWRRNWWGRPVISSGPHHGRPKIVGQTASGTRARRGTVAADTMILPLGTVVWVPGYGYGRVEDRGADILGSRLDIFFPRHGQAEHWGRRTLRVSIWYPK